MSKIIDIHALAPLHHSILTAIVQEDLVPQDMWILAIKRQQREVSTKCMKSWYLLMLHLANGTTDPESGPDNKSARGNTSQTHLQALGIH